ncbi:ATP-binding protein [Oscillospiraceae bacterium LTW-04]|nr:ATP-binding protein [Oscillospiraceae bacterium MB24-C1]
MIKLIVGHKGSGKTKAMIQMANDAVKTSNGNVVCVEKGIQLTYDLNYQVRLVDVEQYGISDYDALYGFLCGLMAGNYDITDIFCDATFRICGKNQERFADMIDKLYKLTSANGLTIVFTVSCEPEELAERIRQYQI